VTAQLQARGRASACSHHSLGALHISTTCLEVGLLPARGPTWPMGVWLPWPLVTHSWPSRPFSPLPTREPEQGSQGTHHVRVCVYVCVCVCVCECVCVCMCLCACACAPPTMRCSSCGRCVRMFWHSSSATHHPGVHSMCCARFTQPSPHVWPLSDTWVKGPFSNVQHERHCEVLEPPVAPRYILQVVGGALAPHACT